MLHFMIILYLNNFFQRKCLCENFLWDSWRGATEQVWICHIFGLYYHSNCALLLFFFNFFPDEKLSFFLFSFFLFFPSSLPSFLSSFLPSLFPTFLLFYLPLFLLSYLPPLLPLSGLFPFPSLLPFPFPFTFPSLFHSPFPSHSRAFPSFFPASSLPYSHPLPIPFLTNKARNKETNV